MAQVNLPVTLGAPFWDKQKALLAKAPKAPATKLPDELKSLVKLHIGIDWSAFGDGKLDSVDEAQSRISDLESAAKGKLKALAEQAQTVETAASKFETEAKKDKAFPKEPLAAAASVAKAAKEYRAEVEEFVVAARKSLAARSAALASQKPKAAPAGAATLDIESKSAKLVRSRGLDVIRRIKKPKPGDKPMRFIVVQGKASVATYMGPSVGPTQEKLLKGLIPTETPFKVFKDPNGTLAWEKNSVTFVSDVLPAGVVKKMQLWLKKILKLNLKLRVRRTSGEVEESEGEDIPDDLLAAGPADAADRARAGQDFQQRLADLQPEIKKALAGPAAAEIRDLLASIAQHTKGEVGEFDEAGSDLDEIEALIEEGGQADGGAIPAAPPVPPAGDAMAEWRARRVAAVTSLKAMAGKIAGAKHPSSAKAIVEIQAVMKNLTAEPSTVQQVTELQRWLGQDEVVNDVCELAEDIRTPLLGALAQLRAQFGA